MAASKMKWGYGPSANIATAVENGTLDTHDMVVTSDTDELVHIQNGGDLQYIKSRISVFNSVAQANASINAEGNHHYLGEPVAILNESGGYDLCTVGSGDSGAYVAAPVVDSHEFMEWVEF